MVAALLFPVVLGGVGLGVETSYWYMTQRRLQHVADVAAHAAAARLRAADSHDQIRVAATHIATSSGFKSAQGTLTVNIPPTSGPLVNAENTVEVVMTESWPRWFTSIFDAGPVTLGARAVAQLEMGATGCVLALSKTAPGAITVAGSTSVTLENCDVASNSNSTTSFSMGGTGSQLTTGCVYAVGQATSTTGLTLTRCPKIHENAPRVRDPYAKIAEPAVVGPCVSDKVGLPNKATALQPTYNHPSGVKSMRFCGGIDLKGQVTFGPGLYIIEGGSFRINGGDKSSLDAAQINASGATFYLAPSASLTLNGSVSMKMSPPDSGPYSGILFFGSRSATSSEQLISGSSGSTFQGALYFPASLVRFRGNSESTDGCTQLIGRIVEFSGTSTLRSACAATGTIPLKANEAIGIME